MLLMRWAAGPANQNDPLSGDGFLLWNSNENNGPAVASDFTTECIVPFDGTITAMSAQWRLVVFPTFRTRVGGVVQFTFIATVSAGSEAQATAVVVTAGDILSVDVTGTATENPGRCVIILQLEAA